MLKRDFVKAVELLSTRYYVLNNYQPGENEGVVSIKLDGELIVTVNNTKVGDLYVCLPPNGDVPHLQTLLYGLVMKYALTPLEKRIQEPRYLIPIAPGQYLYHTSEGLAVSTKPIEWYQFDIDGVMKDFRPTVDLNVMKVAVKND